MKKSRPTLVALFLLLLLPQVGVAVQHIVIPESCDTSRDDDANGLVNDGCPQTTPTCTWGYCSDAGTGTLVVTGTLDVSAGGLAPPSGATLPATCQAQKSQFTLTVPSNTPTAYLCNATGDGWTLLNTSSAVSLADVYANSGTPPTLPLGANGLTVTQATTALSSLQVCDETKTQCWQWYVDAGKGPIETTKVPTDLFFSPPVGKRTGFRNTAGLAGVQIKESEIEAMQFKDRATGGDNAESGYHKVLSKSDGLHVIDSSGGDVGPLGSSSASVYPLLGSTNAYLNTSQANFWGLEGPVALSTSAVISSAIIRIPSAGTVTGLFVSLSCGGPGTGKSFAFCLWDVDANACTALTCTISDSASACNDAHSVSFTATSTYNLHSVPTGTPGNCSAFTILTFSPTTPY